MTISVPKGGYRATFRLNEEPPAAILDDPERLCGQVEWSLLRGSADDISRIQRYVQHAIVSWPGRPDLHVALASTALAALELEHVSPVDRIGLMRHAAHAALQFHPTRGDAEFYAAIHRITGTHKEASIAAAHRWLDFAPQSALAHFWMGRPWLRTAEWATPPCICSRPPDCSPTRPSFRPGSPWGCSVPVAQTPACVTSGPSSRSNHTTIWRTTGSVCWRRTYGGSTRRAMRPPARIRCLAARKHSPRWGSSRRDRELSSQPRPSCTPSPIPTDTSLAPVSARSTSRLDVSIALLESGPLPRQKETGNWAGQRPTRVGMRCGGRLRIFEALNGIKVRSVSGAGSERRCCRRCPGVGPPSETSPIQSLLSPFQWRPATASGRFRT